ncbi:MAG: ABC transporter permease [Candidatus Thorarchaeota archaeon]
MNPFLRVLESTIRKEFRILRRNKAKIGLVVLSPLMFWSGFVLLMGGVYSQGIEAGLVVLETNPGYYTNGLIEILGEHDEIPPSLVLLEMDNDTAYSLFASGEIMLVIVIPEDFEEALGQNETTNIKIWVNNVHEDMTKNLRMPVIRKLDIFYQTYLDDAPLVDFDYELLRTFTYPRLGYMAWTMSIYAVMFGAMFSSGSMITQEFENETFEELEMANQSPIAINAGKMLTGMSVGFIAPPILMIIGLLGFGVWPSGSIGVYLLLTIPLAIIASGIGIVLGAIARSSIYVVPLAALSSLFYWIMGGGMAPLLLAGLGFDWVDSYSPISNAYRSLTSMFVDGNYASLIVDLGVLGISILATLIIAPLVTDRLSRVKYPSISRPKRRR